jgi:hypothetical protein
MPNHGERVRREFSAVYLTLSSVVVALALEKLLDRMTTVAPLPPDSPDGFLIWLSGATLLFTTFGIWLIASYLVLGLRWDIGLLDAAGPFAILVLLSVAIATIGRSWAAFFYVATLGQGSGYLIIRRVLTEARRDPVNEPLLTESDYGRTFAFGALSTVIPLVTAVLLHTGAIGSVGAVVGVALLLLTVIAVVVTFSQAWWRALVAVGATERERQPAAGGRPDLAGDG